MVDPLALGQDEALSTQPPVQPSPNNFFETLLEHDGEQVAEQAAVGDEAEIPLHAGGAQPLDNAEGEVGSRNRRVGQCAGDGPLCTNDAGSTIGGHETLRNGAVEDGHGIGWTGRIRTRLGWVVAEEGIRQDGSDMAVGRLIGGIVCRRSSSSRRRSRRRRVVLLVEVSAEGGGQGVEEASGFLLVDGGGVVDAAEEGRPGTMPQRLGAEHRVVGVRCRVVSCVWLRHACLQFAVLPQCSPPQCELGPSQAPKLPGANPSQGARRP